MGKPLYSSEPLSILWLLDIVDGTEHSSILDSENRTEHSSILDSEDRTEHSSILDSEDGTEHCSITQPLALYIRVYTRKRRLKSASSMKETHCRT